MMRRALESTWLLVINVTLALAILISLLPARIAIGPDAAPCDWRVSVSGLIHGPDSPYRAMVPPSRCYPTRAAAEAALQSE